MRMRKTLYWAIILLFSLIFSTVSQAQSPNISYTNPVNGPIGTSVKIVGSNFGSTQGTSSITFNGTVATPTSWSTTQIMAPVPNGATTGPVVVTVGGVASNKVNFTVGTPPTISYTNPVSGPTGTSITVVGNYFGSTQGSSTITFNGTTATPTSWSNTQVVAPVPSGATTGSVVVTVGGVASNKVNFTVGTPPTISYTNPIAGPVGTSITITGNYFGSTQGSSTITFNGTVATPTSWSNTQVVAPVPNGATTGSVVVTVGGIASNKVNFTVGTPPVISYTNPIDGPVGTSITITGNYFGSTQGSSTITFNGTIATPTSWSNTQIVVPVPSGASTGPIVVTSGGIASNTVNFIVGTPPTISYTNPIAAPTGTAITIAGNYFGSTQGNSTITFNGIAAAPTSWSNTQIVVPVPSGASTGPVVVSVGGMASNSMHFIVGTPPTISYTNPVSAPVGNSITVVGNYFGATQGSSTITFNGIAGTPTSWSNAQIVLPVPSGTSTGPLVVTVGGMAGNSVNFTVLPTPSIASLNPPSGPTGVSVTIAGTNFGATQGTSTVTFNGAPATATSWSAGSIVVPVPAGATTGNVVVTVGGVSSAGSGFTVATLSSLSLTPATASISVSQTLQFTLTGNYSDGTKLNVTSSATWTSSVSDVATVSNSGVATAASVGQTAIQATLGSINASATLGVARFVLTGSLNTARNGNTVTVLNSGNVLVAGGKDSSLNSLLRSELYDPANGSFTATGSLNVARSDHSAILLSNGKVLLTGGRDSSGGDLASTELYDPVSGTFSLAGNLNTSRYFHTATLLKNGKVLIAGGLKQSIACLASAELYDPSTGTFTATGNLSVARAFPTATLLDDGMVLLAGGIDCNGNALGTAELYNPVAGTFVVTGNLNNPRWGQTATLLNNGSVLLAGGDDLTDNPVASAELYNPSVGTFTPTGSMVTGRVYASGTLLDNGSVLVAGGANCCPNNSATSVYSSAELYDSGSGTFIQTSNLNVPQYWQTATLLPNGTVLVVGGNDSNSRVLASAELYQPSTLTPAGLLSISVSPQNPTIAVGGVQPFIATGTFSDSSTQTLASARWSSSNSDVATISNDETNQGVANGASQGSASVSACTGAICGSTALTVGVPTLFSISVNPGNPVLFINSTIQFSASGSYSDGSIRDVSSSVAWASSAPSIATISSAGVTTGLAIGSTMITASIGTANGSVSVTVGPPSLMSMTISPFAPGSLVGATQQFSAIGRFVDGSTQDVTSSVNWASSNTNVVGIGMTGLATGISSGSATITASLGAVSSSVTFVVFPTRTLPTITAAVFPPPNSNGWNNSRVIVTFTCSAGSSTVVSCPNSQTVSSEGANQVVSGTVTDSSGASATTNISLNIETTLPTITIVSPVDLSTLSSPSVSVTGAFTNSLAAISTVICNGTAGLFSGGTFSCNISLVPGVNLVVVTATDLAGNSAQINMHITLNVPLPTPESLQITPSNVNLVVGQTQQFTVVDEQGRPRTDATWNVNDASLATLSTDTPSLLTAVAAGQVTLTATAGVLSAQTQITILSGTSLPAGTVIWSTLPVPGFNFRQIVQAVPTLDGPDLYSADTDDSNQNSLIRAYSGDGRQLWQQQISGYFVNLMPDGFGGVILNALQNSASYGSTPTLIQLDHLTGSPTWQQQSSSPNNPAIRQDGAVVVVEYQPGTNGLFNGTPGSSIIARNGSTGNSSNSVEIPSSNFKFTFPSYCGGSWGGPSPSGNTSPIVDGQGNTYVLVSQINNYVMDPHCYGNDREESWSGTLTLMKVGPDGSNSAQTLSSFAGSDYFFNDGPTQSGYQGSVAEPLNVVPDGRGGVLAAWGPRRIALYGYGPTDNLTPLNVTHVSSNGVNTYQLPFYASNGVSYQLVLGENGTAFATDGSSLVSFDSNSGQINWSYQAPTNSTISIIAAAAGNALVAKTTDQTDIDTVLRFDSAGTSVADPWTGRNVDYALSAMWLGVSNTGAFSGIAAALVDWANSIWSAPTQQETNAATVELHLGVDVIQDGSGANVVGSNYVHSVVDPAISYWQKRAHILLEWDGSIGSDGPCPVTCSPNVEQDPTSLFDPLLDQANNNQAVQQARARFESASGVRVVFIKSGTAPGPINFTGYTMYHVANNQPLFENLTLLSTQSPYAASSQVVAHEIGHMFQLPHVPLGATNLMCGATSPNWFVDWLQSFPCSGLSLNLTSKQILDAQTGARMWVSH